MAKAKLERFLDATQNQQLRKKVPRIARLSPKVAENIWDHVFGDSGALTKEAIFMAGLSVKSTSKETLHELLPEDPPESVIEAMTGAGARPVWAKDIYRAMRTAILAKEDNEL